MATPVEGRSDQGKYVRVLGHDYFPTVLRPLTGQDYLYIAGTIGTLMVIMVFAAFFWASIAFTIITGGMIPCDGSVLAIAVLDTIGGGAFMPWPLEITAMEASRSCGVYEWQRSVAATVSTLIWWKIAAKMGVVRLIASRKGFKPVYVPAAADPDA